MHWTNPIQIRNFLFCTKSTLYVIVDFYVASKFKGDFHKSNRKILNIIQI